MQTSESSATMVELKICLSISVRTYLFLNLVLRVSILPVSTVLDKYGGIVYE